MFLLRVLMIRRMLLEVDKGPGLRTKTSRAAKMQRMRSFHGWLIGRRKTGKLQTELVPADRMLLLSGCRLFHTLEQRLVLSKFPFVIELSKVFGLLREVFPLSKRVPLM